MLAEMEFTGQAFEEMQEQNVRLLQQLREKDDANLKLMSEVRKFHFKYVINDNLGGDCTLPPPPPFLVRSSVISVKSVLPLLSPQWVV